MLYVNICCIYMICMNDVVVYIRLRMHRGLMKTVNYEINGVEGVIRTISHARSGHRTKSCLLSAQKERILKGRALRVGYALTARQVHE